MQRSTPTCDVQVLDGTVDHVWVESLNPVLDDNRTLCLSSGETLPLRAGINLLMEVGALVWALRGRGEGLPPRVGTVRKDHSTLISSPPASAPRRWAASPQPPPATIPCINHHPVRHSVHGPLIHPPPPRVWILHPCFTQMGSIAAASPTTWSPAIVTRCGTAPTGHCTHPSHPRRWTASPQPPPRPSPGAASCSWARRP